MKKLSSVFYMWVGFGTGIIATLAMFLPFIARDGGTYRATSFFFNNTFDFEKGAWPSFVGFMLILVAAIALGVMALPFLQPSAKVEKIVLISAAGCALVGTILAVLLKSLYGAFNPDIAYSLSNYLAGFYFTLIFGLLTVASTVVAIVLDW